MSSIFLSHSHRDKLFATKLSNRLRECGIQTWLDDAELHVGDSLITRIGEAIRESRYLGVIISNHSVSSEWVRREMNIALTDEIHDGRVKVLPLLCERCELPPFLADKIYADFTGNFDEGLETLLERFKSDEADNVQAILEESHVHRKVSNKAVISSFVGLAIVLLGVALIVIAMRHQRDKLNNLHHTVTLQRGTDDQGIPNQAALTNNTKPQIVSGNDYEKPNRNLSESRIQKPQASRNSRVSARRLLEARRLFKEGNYSGAINICETILRIEPQNSLAKKIRAESIYASNY